MKYSYDFPKPTNSYDPAVYSFLCTSVWGQRRPFVVLEGFAIFRNMRLESLQVERTCISSPFFAELFFGIQQCDTSYDRIQ